MPTATLEHWELLATRMAAVPDAYEQYRRGLDDGVARGEMAASRQVTTVLEQLAVWSGERDGPAFFVDLVERLPADVPDPLRRQLVERSERGDRGVGVLPALPPRRVRPQGRGHARRRGRGPVQGVGPATSTGPTSTSTDAYAYGWDEFQRLHAEMEAEAERVLPGVDAEGGDGPPRRARPVHRVGGGAPRVAERPGARGHGGPRRPALRPGARAAAGGGPHRSAGRRRGARTTRRPPRTSAGPASPGYPTQGKTRFPTWEHVSTWYHEGVPGHHLQLAQWVLLSEELSRYQATLGMVSANVEGWALYAERLMDELGFFQDPGRRLGFLVGAAAARRAGGDRHRHAPGARRSRPTSRSTRASAGRRSSAASSCSPTPAPTPASSTARSSATWACPARPSATSSASGCGWPAGRRPARRRGADFDLKAWHMAALSQGSLGLDDLADELAAL